MEKKMKRIFAIPVLMVLLTFSYILDSEAQTSKMVKAEVAAAFDNDCDELLISNIEKAQKNIFGAIYTFTNKDIAEALIKKAKKRVKIKLKIDKVQAEFVYTKTLIKMMQDAGIDIELISMKTLGDHMHHKFAVIDEEIVLTGSFNWTRNAATDNNENIVSLNSKEIAKKFLSAWEKVGQ